MAAPDVTADALRPLAVLARATDGGQRGRGGGPRAGGVPAVPPRGRGARRRRRSSPRSSPGWRSTICARRACGARPTSGAWLPEPLVSGARDRRAGRATTRRCRSPSSRCSSGSRPSSARSTCCTSCSASPTTRSPRSSARAPPTAARSSPRAAPRRRWAAALRAVARAPRGAARALPGRRARAATSTALVGLLAADAVHYADGGGKVRATLRADLRRRQGGAAVGGARAPARGRASSTLLPVDVNGQPGVAVFAPDGALLAVLTVDVADDRVQRVWAVVNPDKLGRAAAALGAEPGGPAPGRRLAERHVRLGAVHPALARARAAAVQRVDLAHAVAQRELAPVARVQVLLELVRRARAS